MSGIRKYPPCLTFFADRKRRRRPTAVYRLLAVLCLMFVFSSASASTATSSVSVEEVSTEETSGSDLQTGLSPAGDAEAEVLPSLRGSGSLGLETAGYLYSPRTKTDEIYPTLMGRGRGIFEKTWFEAAGQGQAMLMAPVSQKDRPEIFFEVPELYVGTSPTIEHVKIAVGRRLQDWNQLDEQWDLGIWQPRYRWDYLRPDTVALTGLNVEVEQPLFRAVFFGSMVYIPERGVPVSTEDGQLISDSPWFISPPRQVQVISRDTPLKYDLRIPPAREIIFQPSFSTMMRIGDVQGPWLSTGYAYKPMNQLLLAFDGELVINASRTDPDNAEVPIVPRVAYHHLASVEAGYNHPNISTWISVLRDRPADTKGSLPGPSWTVQQVTESIAVSPTIELKMLDSRENRMKAMLSYLYQEGGESKALSPESGGIPASANVFEQRYPFHSAIMTGGEIEMPGLARSVGMGWVGSTLISSRILYDIQNRGSIFTTDLKFRPSRAWEAGLGVDLLGSQDSSQFSKDQPNDFIGRYRANDRVRVGVTYVF